MVLKILLVNFISVYEKKSEGSNCFEKLPNMQTQIALIRSNIVHGQIQMGGQGLRTPPAKSQTYKASIQCWAIIGRPGKHHLNGVLLVGGWWPAYSGIWILSPPSYKKNKQKKCQSWAPSDKTSWSRACTTWSY